jgi:hypothetical protein
VLRKIFGTKMEEVTGNWAKLLLRIFFKSTRIKWKGHPLLMCRTEMRARFPKENFQKEEHFEILWKY